MKVPDRVRIVEVGPRDGLQNEKRILSVDARVEFIEALADAGLKTVECRELRFPQVGAANVRYCGGSEADCAECPGVSYPVLVPNFKGLEAAINADAEEIAVFAAASETFSRRNIHRSIAESLALYKDVAARRRRAE